MGTSMLINVKSQMFFLTITKKQSIVEDSDDDATLLSTYEYDHTYFKWLPSSSFCIWIKTETITILVNYFSFTQKFEKYHYIHN